MKKKVKRSTGQENAGIFIQSNQKIHYCLVDNAKEGSSINNNNLGQLGVSKTDKVFLISITVL